MDFARYARLAVAPPYVLEGHLGAGRLLYYGARHTWDPDDPQVRDLIARWHRFRPTIAFNEGGQPRAGLPLREMVARHGESGLVVGLAHALHVPKASLEPPRREEARALAARWSPERIKLFTLLRDLDSLHRGGIGDTPERYLRVLFDNLEEAGVTGPPSTLPELIAACQRHLPALESWDRVPSIWFDPALTLSWTNDLARDSSAYRDAAMVQRLVGRLERGARVLAVVGFTHVVMQEEALSAALDGLTRVSGGLSER